MRCFESKYDFIGDVLFLICFPRNVIIYSHFVRRKKFDKIRDGDGNSKSDVTHSDRVGMNVPATISPFFFSRVLL